MDYKLKINDEIKTMASTPASDRLLRVSLEGKAFDVAYELVSDHRIHLTVNGENVSAFINDAPEGRTVLINGVDYLVEDAAITRVARKGRHSREPIVVTPATPSVVVSILVAKGDRVKKGQGVVVLSAMKMETTVTAPFDGTVTRINATEGASVSPGQILVDVQRDAAASGEAEA
jgi:biotin carboxyl carrier protein